MASSNIRPESMVRITTPELAEAFIDEQIAELRAQIGDKKVLLALSGGVDSSVVAALLIKAVGQQLVCVHVNHGLMRKGESEQVIEVFRNQLGANLIYVDATDRFLDKLAGVADPETKRKIIGAEFIDVFAEEADKLDGIQFLGQGTIYPDILESKDGVKAHHNVGGLPEKYDFELVEPVKLLFKDEVRVVGKALGLPDSMVPKVNPSLFSLNGGKLEMIDSYEKNEFNFYEGIDEENESKNYYINEKNLDDLSENSIFKTLLFIRKKKESISSIETKDSF